MCNISKLFLNVAKGAFIGIGTIIPGVSGGTAAIIMGVFKDILYSTANIFKQFKKSVMFLLPLFIGALGGIIIASKPIEMFCYSMPTLSKYIFCIFSFISCALFIKKSLNFNITLNKLLSLVFGVISALTVTVTTKVFELSINSANSFLLLLIGFILSLALVLPAISFSYMLFFFGLYEKTLSAVSELNLSFLIPLITGILMGSLIFSKFLNNLLEKHSQETYSFILGFVLCSIAEILV